MSIFTPDMLAAGQEALFANARLADGDSVEEIVTAVYKAMEAERPESDLEAVVAQLTRYGGEPDSRVSDLVHFLTRLNDDIHHLRKVGPVLAEIRAKLDEIEKALDLA